jgi:NAD(P)-dependent dehydrogenase (short-subunit alcohol dehydrogenase family)
MRSPATSAGELLRADLLRGVSMFLCIAEGVQGEAIGEAVHDLCASLGANVAGCDTDAHDEGRLDDAVTEAMGRLGGVDLLAVDGAALFETARNDGSDGHAALRACMDGAWNATRAAVNNAFLRAADPRGRIVYVAPPPDAGEHADAARAGLENLARTLSIEWARHRITTVAITPGADTTDAQLAALAAFLVSPAGDYWSGCRVALGETALTA